VAAKQGARWGELRGEHEEPRALAAKLRLIADQYGRRLRDLSQVMPYGRTAISQRLNGETRPEWEFVAALIETCTGRDVRAREVLVGEVRSLWEIADPLNAHHRAAVIPASKEDAPTELAELVGSMHEVAITQRNATRAQLAVTKNIKYLAGLTALLDYLSEDVTRLTRERNALRRELDERADIDVRLQQTRQELAVTQQQLEAAEVARLKTERLLEEALRQRAEAVRIKNDALVTLTGAVQHIANLDTVTSLDNTSTLESSLVHLEPEQGAVEDILRRAERALQEQADDLSQLRVDVSPAVAESSAGRQPDNSDRSRTSRPEVWGRIPRRNLNFTGREDHFDQLREGLAAPEMPLVIYGLGGVGKSQLVLEYAYRHSSDYDVVWWVPADQPVLVRSWLAALAPQLRLPPATVIGIADAAQAVVSALGRGEPFSRWLLIFDNADQPEDLARVIPAGPGHVLITSRNHRWADVASMVAVDVLSRMESVEFLRGRVQHQIEIADAELLAETLGDLPLALEQAGAMLSETGMTASDYLQLLEEHVSKIAPTTDTHEYPTAMTAAWSLSVTSLNERLPQAVILLRCCAFFGPEPIPRDVFNQPRQGLGAQLTSLIDDPIRLSQAIGEISRFALAHIDVGARTIQLHRLIQALLRGEPSYPDQCQIRDEVRLLLAGYAPSDPEDPASWPRYNSLIGHIAPATVSESRVPAVREFALRVVRYLFASANYGDAHRFVERFLEHWMRDDGHLHPDVLRAQLELGSILRELGRYREAAAVTLRSLADSQEAPKGTEDLTLLFLRDHAADLRAAGEFREARARDEDALARCRTRFGPDDRRTLGVLNNLALDQSLNSDYQAARRLHEQVYRAYLAGGWGVEKGALLRAWNGLARAVRLCGDYSQAYDLNDDAYAYSVEELGPDHLWTLRTARDLAIVCRRTGAYERALELAEDTHTRGQRLLGPDHPDTLAAALALANTLRVLGRYEEAFTLLQHAVAQYPNLYGPDHPYSHGCNGNLAAILRLSGDLQTAHRLNETTLAALETRLGPDHHYSLSIAVNQASDLAALGATESACRLGTETLQLLHDKYGPDHPLALACATNLISDLRTADANDQADALHVDTSSRYTRTLGANHPDTVAHAHGLRVECDFDPQPI
jgi:tetratricopeptide (TPR) repeat protein